MKLPSQSRRSLSVASRPVRYRPHVETLESRCLPSTVTNLMDSGPGSLRQAILDTPAGGTVDFQADLTGTITLTTGELALNKDLTIAGPGANVITVNGNQALPLASRVFNIGATFTVQLSGLTVANGRGSPNGGGILNAGTLTLTDCTLSANNAEGGGGGISNAADATLIVRSCTFSANSGGSSIHSIYGGAIYNAGTVMVTDTVFDHNNARLGGAILNAYTLTIIGSTFTNNSAVGPGGGGGINNFGTLTVSASTFSANTAYAAGRGGGGIFSSDTLTVSDSTFTNNQAGFGGGVSFAGTLLLENSIVAGNFNGATASDIAGMVDPASPYNVIGTGGSGGLMNGVNGNQVGVANAGLAPLANNGGPTQTMALLSGSPALNAGDPAQLGAPDQRGVVRSGGVNVGAYQASATALLVSAPRRVQAGVPFDVTVTAVDPFGQVALGYTGTVTFSTSDPRRRVVLPADYTFTLDDGGVHTFTDTGRGETTLRTHGRQTLAVTDTADGSITGQASIRVRRPRQDPGPAPSHRAIPTSPVPGDLVWLPVWSMHHGSAPFAWDWFDGTALSRL